MDKKEIKNQTNLNDIPDFDYEDKPEEIISSIEQFKQSLNNQIQNENNNKANNNDENYKKLLIKELSENLGIELPYNDSNSSVKNNEFAKKTLSTIHEVSNENISHFSLEKKEKKETNKKNSGKIKEKNEEEKMEESIIPNTNNNQNDLMSFYGGNNDIESIVYNLQHNDNMNESFSILKEDYLDVIQFNKITDEQIKKMKKAINPNDLSDCKRVMDTLDYDGKIISRISDINYLLIKAKEIDNKDMTKIKNKIEEEENCLYAWRDILPGGDSFYRDIIFSFLEEVILSRNINDYMTFLFELNKNIENNFFKKLLSYYKIEFLKSKICLILIYYALNIKDKESSIEKAHSLLIKIYNYDINFDLLLTLNLKFLIYKYLKNNEAKLYSREYSVELGSLLPTQYQIQKNKYNFAEFYTNNLLQMNTEPEKIILYVLPYILRRDLFIYSFERQKISHILMKVDGQKNQDFFPFRLIFLNGSYDILYQKEYYNQFQKIFSFFSSFSNNKDNKVDKKNGGNNEKILENIDDNENEENKKPNELMNDNKINNNNIESKNNNHVKNNHLIEKKNHNFSINNIYLNNNDLLNNINNYIDNDNKQYSNNNINYLGNYINNKMNNLNNINDYYNNTKFISNNNKYYTYDNNINILRQTSIINRNNIQYPGKEADALEAFKEIPLQVHNVKMTVRNAPPNIAMANSINYPNNKDNILQTKTKSDIINNPLLNRVNNIISKQCPGCKKSSNDNFYCQKCLFNYLTLYIQNSYIKFIKINILNLIKDRPKENLKNFFSNLTIVFPNKESKKFSEVISLLSSKNKNLFSAKLNDFKSSICLGCFHNINKGNNFISYKEKGEGKNLFLFKFPCGCIFCCKECLDRFLNAVPITKIKSFICGCGMEYEFVQLKFLLYFALSHNLIIFKNEILRYMYEIIKNKCCKCNNEIPLVQGKQNNVNIIEVSDKEAQMIFGINKFNHLICENCAENNDISNNQFYCYLCSSQHLIVNKKNIQNCQIRNTCFIF